jgi:5-methylcytosine-specific restriction endonuclease McrA
MKVLVLNMDYNPINITTLQRGFKLVFKGKAEIVTHEEKSPIKTERTTFKRPTVIRLLRYITVPFRKVNLNRQNLFRRDDYKCVYCGSKEKLTIDHVIPKSKGGPNTWTNLVTCCGGCNVNKGDKDLVDFLNENGLTMHHQPFKPTYLYFVEKINNVNSDWKKFVGIVNN